MARTRWLAPLIPALLIACVTPAASPSPSASEVPSAAPMVTEVPLPITDNQTYVGDLAYDQSHDAIWFMGFDGLGRYVFRLDTTSGRVEKWPLPPGGYIGIYLEIKTDAAGTVWISDDYQVVKFDPQTHRGTAHKFSLAVPGGVPATSPGIGVSAIFPTDNGLLVARRNVPWLTRLDGSLQEVGRIELPEDDDGAQDLAAIGQTIFVERDEHTGATPGVDLLDLTGHLLASVPGDGGWLEVVGSRVLRHGRDIRQDVDVQWVNPDGRAEVVGQGSSAFADPRGGFTLFRHTAGNDQALQRVVDGRVVSQVPYKAEPICVVPPLQSSCIPAFSHFQLSDLITDRKGVTWYATTNTAVVYRVML
jgi:hypothetical protein